MNPLRVLIAEDEQLVLMGLRRCLELLGHKVVGEATDGQEAVRLALDLRPDLILMDINLPVLDGLEAAKRINRSMPVPVIVVTGYSQAPLVDRAKEAGVYAYLVKPVDESDIGPAIELSLHTFSQVRQLKQELAETAERLEARKLIERAKGIIQERRRLTERDAMKFLQQRSRNTNRKLVDVAREVIAAYELLQDPGNTRP